MDLKENAFQDMRDDVEYKKLHRTVFIAWSVLLVGVIFSLAWAYFAPLDKGVSAPGVVVSETMRKTVQYLNSGIVDEILVAEGQSVEAGQVVFKINQVSTISQIGALSENKIGIQHSISALRNSVAQKNEQLKSKIHL